MSGTVFQRRQVERFAQLLDSDQGAAGKHSWSPVDHELAEPLATVGHLGTLVTPECGPDPQFRASLRAMLVATAEREGIGHTAGDTLSVTVPPVRAVRKSRRAFRRPHLTGKRFRGAIIVGVAGSVLTLSGISMASGDALPGDPLYGVKRSTESARLALTGSNVDRGRTYLSFARNRGVEAQAIQDDPAQLQRTLADMDTETIQGTALLTTAAFTRHDSGPLDLLDSFVETQRPRVSGLLTGLSGTNRTRVRQSLDLLDRVKHRSAGLRATLTCGPGDGRTDDLGPLPPTCSHRSTPPSTNSHPDSDTTPTHPPAHPSATPSPAARTPSQHPSGPNPSVSVSPSPTPAGLLDLLIRLLNGL